MLLTWSAHVTRNFLWAPPSHAILFLRIDLVGAPVAPDPLGCSAAQAPHASSPEGRTWRLTDGYTAPQVLRLDDTAGLMICADQTAPLTCTEPMLCANTVARADPVVGAACADAMS